MTIALNELALGLAVVVAFGSMLVAVGTQATIDFTRDEETKRTAQRKQARALVMLAVALMLAAAVFFMTMAPPISFVVSR